MKLMDRSATDKEDVRHMTDAELASLGITIVDRRDLTLRCASCGHTWKPQLGADGKLAFDYWICPSTCQTKKVSAAG